jgi:hypothetical protein
MSSILLRCGRRLPYPQVIVAETMSVHKSSLPSTKYSESYHLRISTARA